MGRSRRCGAVGVGCSVVGLLVMLGMAPPAPAQSSGMRYSPGEGLRWESDGGKVRFLTRGRLMLDGGYVRSDDRTASASEVRRWRLSVSGRLYEDWRFRASYELAGNDPTWKDLRLAYDGFEGFRVTAGQFQEPFSLEELTSSNDLTFMERALPNVFAPGYHLGLGMSTGGKAWTAAAGVFGGAIDGDGEEGWGASARFTGAPVDEDGRVVHLGASLSYREPGDDRLRFRPRPDSHLIDERLVDTRTLRDVASQTVYGLEAAVVVGRLSVQGEWMVAEVTRLEGRASPRFDGGYVYASWMLRGERRHYRAGRFRPVSPQGALGAWEVALRYSTVDLGDAEILGGSESDLTLGLNWYPVSWGRVMLNVIHSEAEGGRNGDQSTDTVQARFQLTF